MDERLIRVTRAGGTSRTWNRTRERWSIDRQSSVQPSKVSSSRRGRDVKCKRSLLVPSIIYAGSQAKEQLEIEMATASERASERTRERERERERERLEGWTRVNPGDSEAEINCFPGKRSDDPFRLRETASIYRRQLRATGPRLSNDPKWNERDTHSIENREMSDECRVKARRALVFIARRVARTLDYRSPFTGGNVSNEMTGWHAGKSC